MVCSFYSMFVCITGDFVLRVFSTKPIVLESVNPIPQYVQSGEWRRVGDLDTTGGPLKIEGSDGVLRENPKWCQNPQYHVEIADPFGKEEVFLKIVLKRSEHKSHSSHKHGGGAGGSAGAGAGAGAGHSSHGGAGHRSGGGHDHGGGGGGGGGGHDGKRVESHLGLVICKADILDESGPKHKKKPPKQNVMGEVSTHISHYILYLS
jgi:hypothetical protein